MIVASLVLASAALDWPSFRPTWDGNAVLPGLLVPPLRRIWVARTTGAIENTVAISGNRAFVATMDGTVECRRLKDGERVWTYRSHSAFSASPTVWRGRVYIGDAGGEFYALDASSGKRLWSRQTGDKIVSSATVAGTRVLFGSYDCRLYCLDASSGKVLWIHTSKAQVHATPSLRGSEVWYAGCDGSVHAVDLSSGRPLRSVKLGGNFAASAVVGGDGVLAGNSTGLLAWISPAGKVRWSVREKEDGAGLYGTPVVWGGLGVVPSRSQRLFALSLATGKLAWTYPAEGAVESSPIAVGSTVVAGDDSGWLHLVRATDGKSIWKTRLGGQIKGSASWNGTLLLVGTTDGRLWAFAGKG